MKQKSSQSKEIMSRRQALQHLGVGVPVALLASGCTAGPNRCADGPESPPPSPDVQEDGTLTPQRLMADIDTFVVVMMENRSFDHVFGMLAEDSDYPGRRLVDGLRGTEQNEDDDGTIITMKRAPEIPTHGPIHTWDGAHKAFGKGRNDGFVKANAGRDKTDAMTYLTREDLPLQYALADQFTICDRWFSSVMGPTWPNRYFLHAATSSGNTANEAVIDGPPTIWEKLGKNCWSCKNYAAGPAHWYHAAFRARPFNGNDPFPAARIEEFFRDARTGNLPSFSLIDPDYWLNDFHPPHRLDLSEALLGSIVQAVQESPQYKRSLLIIIYDENGGFYDHVPPPITIDTNAAFRQLGFRVPAIIVGPSVRKGQVISQTLEHVSVAATLKARFGIESLGPRMDAASNVSACIDPERIGLPPGPLAKLPKLRIRKSDIKHAHAGYSSQPGIDQAIAAGLIPAHTIDTRSHEERLRSVLRHIQELEAAVVIG